MKTSGVTLIKMNNGDMVTSASLIDMSGKEVEEGEE